MHNSMTIAIKNFLAAIAVVGVLAGGLVAASAADTGKDADQVNAPPPLISAGSDPVALIKQIYDAYSEGRVNLADDIFSHRLQALVDADQKKNEGYAPKLDWVFVNDSDYIIGDVKVVQLWRSGTQARVRTRFDNHDKPQEVTFDLVNEDGAWHIDEVRSTRKGGRWTMSKILTAGTDAGADRRKKKN